MAFTYDPTTDRGKVRRNIGDKDTATAANQMFTDAEIDSFLSSSGSDVKLATAEALRAMAADPALRAIRYRTLGSDGIEIDKREMAAQLREAAQEWETSAREQAGPSEEIDSMDYALGPFGTDRSEYVGEVP